MRVGGLWGGVRGVREVVGASARWWVVVREVGGVVGRKGRKKKKGENVISKKGSSFPSNYFFF